ncbi:MAG: serine/threonine-protein kinase [Planctomycetota bacterium]
MSDRTPCRPELIEAFLVMPEGSEEFLRIERHLDNCEACQEHLQTKAAQLDFWHTTAQMLDESSDQTLWDSEAAGMAHAPSEAFLRQWLEASDSEDSMGRLAGYEILEVLGQGGMGLVVKAQDRQLDRHVAIKVIHPHLVGNRTARARFAREARLAACLRHKHVIEIYGVHEWSGVPFLVMPLMDGCLSDYADKHDLDTLSVVRFAKQLAAGLQVAHSSGLVHRDIKPSNILVQHHEKELVISDFGLARALDDHSLTQTGILAGTPLFMSPEQALGEATDTRSDIFSLGSVLYWMITGRAPFAADASYGTLRRIIESEHRPADQLNSNCPAWLSRLVDLLLEKKREQRTLTAAKLAEMLGRCERHLESPDVVDLPKPLQSRQALPARNLGVVAAIVGIFLLLLAPAIYGTIDWAMQAQDDQQTAADETGKNDETLTKQQIQPAENIEDSVSQDSASADDGMLQETEPPAFSLQGRMGPLDELDLLNMHADLRAEERADYWLERLASLPNSEFPKSSLILVENYLDSNQPTLQNLAKQILSRTPKQEPHAENTALETTSPFEEVTIDSDG